MEARWASIKEIEHQDGSAFVGFWGAGLNLGRWYCFSHDWQYKLSEIMSLSQTSVVSKKWLFRASTKPKKWNASSVLADIHVLRCYNEIIRTHVAPMVFVVRYFLAVLFDCCTKKKKCPEKYASYFFVIVQLPL